MQLIYEPKVIVATVSVFRDYDLKDYASGMHAQNTHSLDHIPEFAGRVCYQSFKNPRPGGNRGYIGHILEASHGNVLEHSYVGLLITGVSRSLTHELIRHRAGTAFSQLSQRYVEPDNLGYIVPPLIIRDLVAEQCFKTEVTAASASYDRMLNVCTTAISRRWQDDHPDETADREALTYIRKKAREAARSVLPNSIETHIFMSGNLRAWRNILEQRGSIHADLEIRRLAVAIARSLYVYATSVFQDMHIFIDVDGYESLRFEHRKV